MSFFLHQITRQVVVDALTRDEFVPFYQPIIDSEGNLTAVEILMRWRKSTDKILSANIFIVQLEKLGLLGIVTSEVFKKVTQDLSYISGLKRHLKIFINCSPPQIQASSFVYECFSLMEGMDLNRYSLAIEITESLPVTDIDSLKKNIQRLKLAGVIFFLDDFGCGHSNLALLHALDVEGIKIDKRFIRGIHNDPESQIITSFIINLANSLDLEVIAEGIESKEQLEILSKLGAHKHQGYFISKPLDIRGLKNLILLS